MSGRSRDDQIQEVIDKMAIMDVLHTYCRGMDRGDAQILADAYWPDAYEYHTEMHSSPVAEFVEWSIGLVKPWRTQHRVTNIMVRIDDATHARSESYVWAYHRIPTDDGAHEDVVAGGRYLDHLEKRGDVWKIIRRHLIMDYFTKAVSAEDMGFFGTLEMSGRKDHDDPLYAHMLNDRVA